MSGYNKEIIEEQIWEKVENTGQNSLMLYLL